MVSCGKRGALLIAEPAANMVAANHPPAAAMASDDSQIDGAVTVSSRSLLCCVWSLVWQGGHRKIICEGANAIGVAALSFVCQTEPESSMRASSFATTTLLTALALATAAQAAPGPFRALAGSWAGGGTLSMSSGEQERLRCRAAYDVGGGGDQLRLNIRCASDSYNIDLSSDVAYRG